MSDGTTATGAKIFIGPSVTSTTDTAVKYAALTWVEIGMVESIGEYGDESSTVSFSTLGDGRTRKAKGARDAGTLALSVIHAPDDLGQQALQAAEASNANFAFKVVLPNRLTVTGTDEINYFRGLVSSKRKNIGGNDNVIKRTFNVAVNSELIEVAPTAGV